MRISASVTKRQEGYNVFMEHALAIAGAELDEQKRTFGWHTMPLQSMKHRRALLLVDEFALGALEVDGLVLGAAAAAAAVRAGIGRAPTTTATATNATATTATAVAENEKDEEAVETKTPKLCPLIQTGLDRQWLASQLGGDNEEIEQSLDTMASFKCSVSRPTALRIAQLHNSRRISSDLQYGCTRS